MTKLHERHGERSAARLSRRELLVRGSIGLAAAGLAATATGAAAQENRAMLQAQPDVPAERMAATLAALDTLASEALARTGVPGMAIAVVHNDQQIFAKGYGVRDSAGSDPIDADTVFRLASMAKPVSSTVAAALVGDGRASWDARISDLMPEVEMYDPWVTRELTVRDCLCHRSGTPAYDGDLLVDLGYDRATILHRLRFYRPASSFRSTYAYNNLSYTLGNVAAARAAGMVWEDAAVERLFTPLGMRRTSMRYADYLATPNRALTHFRVDGTWQHLYESFDDPYAPAGNVSSSVNDLSRWMRLQINGGAFEGRQLVAADALAETHRPQIASSTSATPHIAPRFYGLGWAIEYVAGGQLQLNHSGAFTYGAATTVGLRPVQTLGIVVLTNAFPIGLPEAMVAAFYDLIDNGTLTEDWVDVFGRSFAAFISSVTNGGGHDYAVLPAEVTPAQSNAAYLGSYSNELYGQVWVVEQNGALVLQMGPRPDTFPLKHYDHDVFSYVPLGYGPNALRGVTFTIGPDGRASKLLVDEFNANGQGMCPRVADAT